MGVRAQALLLPEHYTNTAPSPHTLGLALFRLRGSMLGTPTAHLLATEPWASYFTPLSLSLLLFEVTGVVGSIK